MDHRAGSAALRAERAGHRDAPRRRLGLDSPDYATAIDRLAELGVLTPEFASRLRPIAGFRNVLVHGYLQVDLDVLERVLREKLTDLEEFAVRVEAYLALIRPNSAMSAIVCMAGNLY